MFNVVDRTRGAGATQACYELTSFGSHLLISELERHNSDEYKSYEYTELECDPEYCPYYSSGIELCIVS